MTTFKLDSEKALLDAFRPRDRRHVELPPGTSYPLLVHDYLAWTHPAGGHVYLVFVAPGGVPTGIAFDSAGGSAAGVPQLCTWCHSSVHGDGPGVGMLVATLHGRKRVGVHVCADLGCAKRLEEEANRSGRSVRPAIEKLLGRMATFAREGLGLDPGGGGR